MPTLFHYPWSPYGRKALFAAYETGARFQDAITPPFLPEAMAELRARTFPLATVPTLLLDDGTSLTESSLIVEYFDLEREGGAQLVPRDPRAALEVRALDRLADALMSPAVSLIWALRRPEAEQNPKRVQEHLARIGVVLGWFETLLDGHQFLFAEQLTMADIALVSALSVLLTHPLRTDDDRCLGFEQVAMYPALMRWYRSICERDAWQRLVATSERTPTPNQLLTT